MRESDKTHVLRQFESEASGLREAAEAVDALRAVSTAWGPREVLAHIALWAIQATEHFRLGLPLLDYGDTIGWRPALIGTFNTAFAVLAGSTRSPEAAQQVGWEAVTKSGVTLPLAVADTPEQHLRVDDAFNAAAVELVRDRPFDDILRLTEEAHANLLRLLEQRPADEYVPGAHLYQRMLLVIAHHAEHRAQLEAQLPEATAPSP